MQVGVGTNCPPEPWNDSDALPCGMAVEGADASPTMGETPAETTERQ